jgi:hypothetical protein
MLLFDQYGWQVVNGKVIFGSWYLLLAAMSASMKIDDNFLISFD